MFDAEPLQIGSVQLQSAYRFIACHKIILANPRSCFHMFWRQPSPPSNGFRRLLITIQRAASFDTPCRNPEQPRRRDGIDSPPPPPGDLVSEAVVVAVVGSAQGYGELVAHL